MKRKEQLRTDITLLNYPAAAAAVVFHIEF
jgi:hypothetical protein